MSESIKLNINGKDFEFPLVVGTDGNKGIDFTSLYSKTGLVSFDPGLFNTAFGYSKVSKRDPIANELYYRGYSVEDLALNSTFVETAYLLIYGDLPNATDQANFSKKLSKHSMIHEDMINLFDGFPGKNSPLAYLSALMTSLSTYYPEDYEEGLDKGIDQTARILAKIRTIAAFSYKKMIGQPLIYPLDRLPYCSNFLHMMHAVPAEPYEVDPSYDRVLNQIWILYADHEQNVSNTAVQIVGTAKANLFASIGAGICAQFGVREGGRTIAAVELIQEIIKSKVTVSDYMERLKKSDTDLHSLGFGHKAYEGISPRARVAKTIFNDFYKNRTLTPVEEKAMEIVEFTTKDSYFLERNLYPNLEFYSAVIFHTLGIPKQLFSVMQTIGRLPGWLAHWRELRKKGDFSKVRPKQIYVGENNRKYIPIQSRI
jgi:citrate synthase